MKKILIVGILVLTASSAALGWGVFNDGAGNNCALCHDGNVVMSTHPTVDCLACHVAAPGDVPVTSNCSVCHGAGGIVNFHNGAGIASCAVCHADMPSECFSWGELKEFYKK